MSTSEFFSDQNQQTVQSLKTAIKLEELDENSPMRDAEEEDEKANSK